MEKPAILSDEELSNWYATQWEKQGYRLNHTGTRDREAQRDDTYQKMLDAYEPLIKEAKAEVAREIFEAIEHKWGWISDKLDKIVIDDYGYWGREGSMKDWQSLKSKYTEGKVLKEMK